MPRIIAFAGKGGVGKTTVSGMLIRYLVERVHNGPVLAVDADANSNLNEVLGIKVHTTIGEARELLRKDVPAGMPKETWFEYKVHEAVIEAGGFDLLVMGRPEGTGCYCAANTLAKKHIEALKDNYAWVVVDNEAGMEHMSRLVTQDVDVLYVISDPSPRGLLTAKRIVELVAELKLNVGRIAVIVNRVGHDEIPKLAGQNGLEVSGFIRNDELVTESDREGVPVFRLSEGSAALTDAYAIFDTTLGGKE